MDSLYAVSAVLFPVAIVAAIVAIDAILGWSESNY